MDQKNLSKPFYCDTMTSESSIPNDFALVSKNGLFEARIQMDGNFVVYKHPEKKVLWTSKTYGKGVAPYTLRLQNDGNLVVYDGRNSVIWASATNGKGQAPYKLVMLDDGNLTLRDSKELIFWGSWTKQYD